MSTIRLQEIPCTDESSNLSPSILFGILDPTGRGTRCMASMKICALDPRVNSCTSCHSTQILDAQISMSFIRQLEIPCTDESSNLSPSTLFGIFDPTGHDTRCMASMKICAPDPRATGVFVSSFDTDPGCSNFDELNKAVGNSLYGRVPQSQSVDIVWYS